MGVKEEQVIVVWSIGGAGYRPAVEALTQIGLPSVPAVMKVFREDDAEVRSQGMKVLASVVVLCETKMLLKEAVKSEHDETARKNLEAALSRMEESRMRPMLEKLDKERIERLLGRSVN